MASDVTSLQIAINRYAGAGGFAAISVTDTVNQATGQALLKALSYISSQSTDEQETSTAQALVSQIVPTGAIDLGRIQSSASGLSQFLNSNADELGLPAAVAQKIASAPTEIVMPEMLISADGKPMALTTDISHVWTKLPTWQKIAAGLVAGLAVLFVYNQTKKASGKSLGDCVC